MQDLYHQPYLPDPILPLKALVISWNSEVLKVSWYSSTESEIEGLDAGHDLCGSYHTED